MSYIKKFVLRQITLDFRYKNAVLLSVSLRDESNMIVNSEEGWGQDNMMYKASHHNHPPACTALTAAPTQLEDRALL